MNPSSFCNQDGKRSYIQTIQEHLVFFFHRIRIHHEWIMLSSLSLFLYLRWSNRTHFAHGNVKSHHRWYSTSIQSWPRECQPIHESHDGFRTWPTGLDSTLSLAWVVRLWLSKGRVSILPFSLLETWSMRPRSVNIIRKRATITAFGFSSTRSSTNLRICVDYIRISYILHKFNASIDYVNFYDP